MALTRRRLLRWTIGVVRAAVVPSRRRLPSRSLDLTFAQPTKLGVAGADVVVLGADSELSARVGQAEAPGETVLVANQVLPLSWPWWTSNSPTFAVVSSWSMPPAGAVRQPELSVGAAGRVTG